MAGYFRLQELVGVLSDRSQEREYAVDVGPYRTLTVEVRVVVAATTGNLYLDHAAVNDDSFYYAVSDVTTTALPINLSSAGTTVLVIESPLRFIRWRTANMSGTAEFIIDVVARET